MAEEEKLDGPAETAKADDAAAAAAAAEGAEAAPAPAAPEADAEPTGPKPFGPDDCPKCEECPPCVKGAPAWMATFADLATLLMAFFVLILSFAEMNVPKFKQINGSLKNSFGVQRLIPVVESPKAQSLIAQSFSPSMAQPTPVNTIRQQTEDDRKEEVELKTDVAPEAEQAVKDMRELLAQEISRGEVEVKLENGKVVVEMVATPTSATGGGQGASGQQSGGAGASGTATAGAAPQGAASAGASAQGAQAAGSAASGQGQAGMVPQGEIDFYAKVADAQAQVGAPVEVRDVRNGGSQGRGQGAPNAQDQSESEFERIRRELASQIADGKAEVERDGARIIIRLAEQGSFRSGSADLQPGFTALLRDVGQSVAPTPGRVFIEGHTDNVPVVFNDRFRSNWDLSGARAGAVADFMTTQGGVTPGRVSVAGFADTRPIDSNDNAQGRSRNRRIEIIIDGAG
jgi:chemotaxis protein MotB